MFNYHVLLRDVMSDGEDIMDRTGVGTRSVFGRQLTFRNEPGGDFPLLTTKSIHWKSVVLELLWFIHGGTNIRYLRENGVRIWNEWADKAGNLGPVYGKQWRAWEGPDGKIHDQLATVINQIRNTPFSRRILVNAWNVSDLDRMALPPCHLMFQFRVTPKGHLDMMFYMRSADLFLGVPFNIASYALLQRMVAHVTGTKSRDLILTLGDAHIYRNHFSQVQELLDRSQNPPMPPKLELDSEVREIDDFDFEDIQLIAYKPMPKLPAPVAV